MESATKASQYIEFVSFMQFDDDFVVFPRFDRLNICNLLHLQSKLSKLDEELVVLAKTRPPGKDFDELMDRIQCTLKIYSKHTRHLSDQIASDL